VTASIPLWAVGILRCPDTHNALKIIDDRIVSTAGEEIAKVIDGIVRFPVSVEDHNVKMYRAVGGSHFWERAKAGYAMSALDTPVYHQHLERAQPTSKNDIIVDVGGGDGRNARPWLEKGFQRVIIVDAVAEALARFRERIASEHPEWLDRILLVEADARRLPLAAGCAETVLAIESLCYLDDDYELGVRQCYALLAPKGRLLLSERDREGGLLLRLLYQGIEGMLEVSRTGIIVDGPPDAPMRTRAFTELELTTLLNDTGLDIRSIHGISLFSVVLGWMQNKHLLDPRNMAHLPAIATLLGELGQEGRARRCHVIVAQRP
jgi:SAM-dependent methyltransferase